jgi:hypothetical protein
MRRLSSKRPHLVLLLALLTVLPAALAGGAAGAAQGWTHLGTAGTPGSHSLNGHVYALAETPGVLYVGGAFTNAGGNVNADRIAKWNGSSWSAVSSAGSQITNGAVFALAVAGGKVYAGGTFQNAGGNTNADYLAVWDGVSWAPFCNPTVGMGPAFDGNVVALQVIGSTLYAGGSFQNGAGLASADYLLACSLNDGASSSTVVDPAHPFSSSVYALTADSGGALYVGGGFSDLEGVLAADKVVYRDSGSWNAMGSGGGTCGCAVNDFVRSLAANGTNVYVGTDAVDIAGIPQADHVGLWNGSAWSAVGANTAGTNGWFPTSASIDALTTHGSQVFATGQFQDANGDPRADVIAYFDGSAWHSIRSDGLGGGPLNGHGMALAVFGQSLYAGGAFTKAGGDAQAQFIASIPLTELAGDATRPTTTITSLRIEGHKATLKFASNESGVKFLCKLDKKAFTSCKSRRVYTKLKPGRHEFRVKAKDRAGNVDATPALRKFTIKP